MYIPNVTPQGNQGVDDVDIDAHPKRICFKSIPVGAGVGFAALEAKRVDMVMEKGNVILT
jgi:hypothetical protein